MIFFDINNDTIYINTENDIYEKEVDCDEMIWESVLKKNGFKIHAENKILHLVLGDNKFPVCNKKCHSLDENKNPIIFAEILSYTKDEIIISLYIDNKTPSMFGKSLINLLYENKDSFDIKKLEVFV
jgi:hypothetical protein